ncbi:hypothetical protein PVAP13_9NG296300 [Panicum virgatum]|jgi:hypothetical protein|uniref:Uncharacterized protein n=1 Tax=Panicum virgatum TaxID=38727 RepID=A0A8T0MPZ5_PANVG|nr:hypothetical protein PVAP13_9NG296300 [Panicum virgatum]
MGKITAMAAAAITLLLLPLGQAEERPTAAHPHGLPFESPLTLSPAAYDFFHPSARARRAPGVASGPALAPRGQQQLRESAVRGTTASVARADQEEGGVAPVRTFRHRTVAGVFIGAVAAALVAVGVAYAVVRRRMVAARRGAGADAGAPKSIA